MNPQKLAAALRERAKPYNNHGVTAAILAVADALDECADQSAPAPTPDVVRDALEAMLRHSGVADMDPRDKDPDDVIAESLARAALAALDAPPADPEWAWVHCGFTGDGDLRIKLARDGIVQIIDAAMTPDDLLRIATACRIRAAQLRREGK